MKPQLIIGMSFLLMACVQVNPTREISSEEKADVYLKMGVRYLEMGQLKIAKENLEKSLDEDSSNAEAHNAIAVLYERIRRFDDARDHYERAISLDDESPQPKNNYGRFLCDRKEYKEGLLHLSAAFNMPLNKRKWFSLTNAGLCKLKQGNNTQAENYFRAALQFHPNYHPALKEMLKISYHQRKYMSARAFLQRYSSLAPETAEVLWYAYQTERSLHNIQVAEQYRSKLIQKFPESNEAKKLR